MNASTGYLDDILTAATRKIDALSAKAERASAALDVLSRELDARVDAACAPKETRT
ncbi:hypothetical protein [Mameliella sediminis]|uniref:hypothetical protein n=1 Tax=Mameliella sediminis TaxID=2836866 RepID=UPI001C4728B7|nr:hypothetical protein [Mameliella sediminis]MBY6115523.1 hypothetical protein [Antarctobacter heliothermus]MBY6145770.1 hypothetical protein [Mameliella alba]MBV7393507.1 hypothetical protein [Mameliella sediminis]MBY6161093.1 hypothetical protein [Mameliella alba]MBY6169563.1 hypothetical protein [Mameliella alba]